MKSHSMLQVGNETIEQKPMENKIFEIVIVKKKMKKSMCCISKKKKKIKC